MQQCHELPLWGPYSKKYMGISKVVQESPFTPDGARFDLVVHPAITFSNTPPPNVTVPCGFHPWDASPDLSAFSYRCELLQGELVFADVAFRAITPGSSAISVAFTNNSDLPQSCLINLFAAIEHKSLISTTLETPVAAASWNALDYACYDYANPRPWDTLSPDGTKKGEFSDYSFCDGHGLGDRFSREFVISYPEKAFGEDNGDSVTYRKEINDYDDGVLFIRYRTPRNEHAQFVLKRTIRGITTFHELSFPASRELTFVKADLGLMRYGTLELELTSLGTGGLELDCFAVVERRDAENVRVRKSHRNVRPNIVNDSPGCFTYCYEGISESFHLKCFGSRLLTRDVTTGCLEDCTITKLTSQYALSTDLCKPHSGSFVRKVQDGYYHNVVDHSIIVQPHTTVTHYFTVGSEPSAFQNVEDCESFFSLSGDGSSLWSPDGKRYALSQRLLKAALLTNIVYPIWCCGKNVRHFTPGKRWDSLYTWDSGFIGLGLLEHNPKYSEYILDLYLAEDNNPHFAFVNHGSPVPVAIILLFEMLQRRNDKSPLYPFYSRAKRFYDFLAGKAPGSTTAKFKTGLTNTYDYFYNASGMDDLPAQLFVFHNGKQQTIAPVISTTMLILSASILSQIAAHCGAEADCPVYLQDIVFFTNALQKWSWDEDAGYFSYVEHDSNGEFLSQLKYCGVENFNKGMEGVVPYIADCCTPPQERKLLSHVFSSTEMFSPVGISAVDMSSSYYSPAGYWNGNVWFPYQWFMWKALLDHGESDKAFHVAVTALEAWKSESDFSHNTYEGINIETGRGGIFHQFGGLSSPINIWAAAYYRIGTITVGFKTWLTNVHFNREYSQLEFSFDNTSAHYSTLIVTMSPSYGEYSASLLGKPIPVVRRTDSALELLLPPATKGSVKISKYTTKGEKL